MVRGLRLKRDEGWDEREERKKGALTRLHMLQSHSTIGSSYVPSSGFVFRATVTAPQWHPPVYILLFAPTSSAGGAGPSNWGGLQSCDGGDVLLLILPTQEAS